MDKKCIDNELKEIDALISEFAKTAEKDGIYWRATYTEEDRKGVVFLKSEMEKRGFSTYFDEVGDLIGRIEGKSKETVLVGSHRDTVKDGGKFDGALGIITAMEAAGALLAEKGKPKKTVEVIALCEEEGSRFLTGYTGSFAIVGALSEEHLEEKDDDGITLREAIIENGYSAVIPPKRNDIVNTLELHIEQGGVLENEGKKAGIVTAIAGLLIGRVTLKGEQNHAGTTPMNLRHDAVVHASKLIHDAADYIKQRSSEAVCTFGEIKTVPGKYNVIPSSVELSFDIRSGDIEVLNDAKKWLDSYKPADDKIEISVAYPLLDKPALMSDEGLELLKEIAEEEKLSYMTMVSGAGHDSQVFAEHFKANMIFVPSKNGISHSPDEFTASEDIEDGYILLKKYIEKIAW